MPKNPILVLIVMVILSACGSEKASWDANGKWIDLFAEIEQCDKQFLWEMGLNVKQDGLMVTGSAYFSFFDGENILNIPGTFSGSMSGNTLKGTAVYTRNDSKLELDFDLNNNAEILRGSFSTTHVDPCDDGSQDRITGDVVFITESPEPVGSDSQEPNNLASTAKTLLNGQLLENLTISKKDVDWFKFEVKTTSQIRIDLELLSNFPSRFGGPFSQSQVIKNSLEALSLEPQANILPVERILQKGMYYIAISAGNDQNFKGKHNANGKYSLELTVTELPDSDYEPNDTKNIASPITLDFEDKLYLNRSDQGSVDVDWFSFEITESQLVLLHLLPQQNFATYFSLQSSNGFPILYDVYSGNSNYEVALDPDTYYLAIGSAAPTKAFPYDLALTSSDIPDETVEPNNTRATATHINLDFAQTLFLYPGDEDWLKFSLGESQVVRFDVSDAKSDFAFELYQGSTTIFNSSQSVEPIQTRVLGAGDYYFRASDAFANVSYPLSIKASVIPDQDLEPNNSFNSARAIDTFPFNRTLALDNLDDEDWFSFQLSEPQLITVSINKGMFGLVSGDFVDPLGSPVGAFEVGDIPIHSFAFEAGTYFLKLYDDTSSGFVFDTSITSDGFSDTEYEPNNAKGEAAPLDLGFGDDNLFVVSTEHPSLGDEDWFSFSLDKTTQVAINILTDTFVDATLYDAGDNIIQSLGPDSDPILGIGTYYIQVSSSSASKYSLSLSVK